MVSGGAPLNTDVGLFFQAMGLPMLQGYGQTEAGPVISCNRPKAGIRMETVGPPMMNTEVRIAEDGEIMVRGENVMHGYWRNPEETARVLHDGWLHTGDVGHLDAEGRIVITDRKKDLIVLDKGDNVSPQRVEGMLTLQPEIAQAMVYGDRHPYLVGLLVPGVRNSPTRPTCRSRLSRERRPGQCRAVSDGKGAPLHPCRRPVHGRERTIDPVDEDPAARHPRCLWRAAGRALQALVVSPDVGHEIARASRRRAVIPDELSTTVARSPRHNCGPMLRVTSALPLRSRFMHPPSGLLT